VIPEHRHPQEQTGYLVSGRLEFSIDGAKLVAEPGSSWSLPADLPHSASALEDSIVVEVFSPVREDYLPT
jgi:quercetin dioxygenase-like cupin family protein